MYCPSCGAESTAALSYCKRCGANLKPATTHTGGVPAKLVGATWAISSAVVLVTLGGFGMLFALVMTLIGMGVNISGTGMVLISLSLIVILTIALLLIRQLSRVLDISELLGANNQSNQPRPQQLKEQPVAELNAVSEPISSVTEHTTRTFEPVLRERDTSR